MTPSINPLQELEEEIQANILNKLPKEVVELVGRHSTLWNYTKMETLDALAEILSLLINEAVVAELERWLAMVTWPNNYQAMQKDMKARIKSLKESPK